MYRSPQSVTCVPSRHQFVLPHITAVVHNVNHCSTTGGCGLFVGGPCERTKRRDPDGTHPPNLCTTRPALTHPCSTVSNRRTLSSSRSDRFAPPPPPPPLPSVVLLYRHSPSSLRLGCDLAITAGLQTAVGAGGSEDAEAARLRAMYTTIESQVT